MSYPERPHSALPGPAEDRDESCQACVDGVKHVSCEPYFDAGPADFATLVERVGPLLMTALATSVPPGYAGDLEYAEEHVPSVMNCSSYGVAQIILLKAIAEGRRREREARKLDMNNETLVAEIAFDIGQATKMQPAMDGRCRRLHNDDENRRIARAVIRSINAIAARGAKP